MNPHDIQNPALVALVATSALSVVVLLILLVLWQDALEGDSELKELHPVGAPKPNPLPSLRVVVVGGLLLLDALIIGAHFHMIGELL